MRPSRGGGLHDHHPSAGRRRRRTRDALDGASLQPGEADPGRRAVDRHGRADPRGGPLVERHLGIEIPTREEMADIEPSEILYREERPAT